MIITVYVATVLRSQKQSVSKEVKTMKSKSLSNRWSHVSLLLATLVINTLFVGCSEPNASEQSDSESLTGVWRAIYQAPGLGQIESTYRFDQDGTASGQAKATDGMTVFLGTWSSKNAQPHMTGKRMTIVGSSTNSVNISRSLKQHGADRLEIDGVLHARHQSQLH